MRKSRNMAHATHSLIHHSLIKSGMKSTFWKVWGVPIIIGILSAAGLLSALTGDGVWDLVSWVSLGVPVLVAIWFVPWRRSRQVAKKVNRS